jgi:hypothetical protein
MTQITVFQITLSQAQAAQTEEFPSWDQLSLVEQLHTEWWDAYKDAYGFRPRGQDVGHWTAEDFRQELESLSKAIESAEQIRREEESKFVVRFSKRIEETINLGAKNRETALRWIMDADDCGEDWEYLCYRNGLPYDYFREAA